MKSHNHQAIDTEEGRGENDEPNNDDRWAVIWAALIIYWAIDAVVTFVVALAAFIASIVVKIIIAKQVDTDDEKNCDNANTIFLISLTILLVRFIDMILGCCTIGCWFCSSNNADSDRQMVPHIRNCIIISTGQCFLALANIVLGIIGLVSEGTDCVGSVVTIVFAALLIMDSCFEMTIWIGAYIIRINQDKAQIPKIVDKIMPNCLVRWAQRTRL